MTEMKDYQCFAEAIESADGDAYFVGGYPRDKISLREHHDVDIMVTGLSVEGFLSLFPDIGMVGKEFGVFEIFLDGKRTEVALARAEKKDGVGYKGFLIYSSPEVTVEQDLLRRDLTINSMAIHILSGVVIDPYNGRQDLENGIIRATSPAFAEDPLRVYRAARFAARFGFTVEENTLRMMNSLRDELPNLSAERVSQELISALNTKKPSAFFNTLRQAGVLDVHYKEVDDLFSVPQSQVSHPEGDAGIHTMMVMDKAANIPNSDTKLVFAALVHDLGKVLTPAELLPKHVGHELAGVPLVHLLANRLKLSKQLENAGAFGAEYHGRVHILDKMRSVKIVDLLVAAQKSALGIEGLVSLAIADGLGKEHPMVHSVVGWSREISSVKANPELSIANIAEDKRVRQAKLLDTIR
jgi:tRNA nucleotidyltransferase (CCA-adding enzyme)